MKYLITKLFVIFSVCCAFASEKAVYQAHNSGPVEQLAAEELLKYLNQMYPTDDFVLTNERESVAVIKLMMVKGGSSQHSEAFNIFKEGRQLIIQSAGANGLLYGVFAFLEQQGCYFRLSDEYVPTYKNTSFRIPDINIQDRPLADKRIVFNWFNFLSGCSSWDLEDWQLYIRQSSKQRYNSLMIHTYGNNPMLRFFYHGQEKPLAFMASTYVARDYGTQHVNDVRNMPGADNLFSKKVFGAKAALVPEEQKHESARKLMQQVFDYAHKWGMKIIFANDMDSENANPQNILRTLPKNALIQVRGGKYVVANPETAEGYQYYKSQVQQMFIDYPQIDEYTVWNRGHSPIWGLIKKKDMPLTWQKEYEKIFGKETPFHVSVFAWSKVLNTHKKILKDIGRDEVKLSTGSWRFDFLSPMNKVADKSISFYPLDYHTNFDGKESQSKVKAVSKERRIVPILWAHHDDRKYFGRPYRPFANLATTFEQSNTHDFGIIHWTTRPLESYFKNTMQQLWTSTRNLPLQSTFAAYSQAIFPNQDSALFKDYLVDWMQNAPMFGRETRDKVIDRKLGATEKMISECSKRIAFLEKINQKEIPAYTRNLIQFHLNYDRFTKSFYEDQSAVDQLDSLLNAGNTGKATELLKNVDPVNTIRIFSETIQSRDVTKGDLGLLVSLNTRWLPQVTAAKQSLGITPIAYRFGTTIHDPSAQAPGSHTFFFDQDENLAQVLGARETGLKELNSQSNANRFQGMLIDDTLKFSLKPFVGHKFSKSLKGNLHIQVSGKEHADTRLAVSQASVNKAGKSIKLEGKKVEEIVLPVQIEGEEAVIKFDTNHPVVLKEITFVVD